MVVFVDIFFWTWLYAGEPSNDIAFNIVTNWFLSVALGGAESSIYSLLIFNRLKSTVNRTTAQDYYSVVAT